MIGVRRARYLLAAIGLLVLPHRGHAGVADFISGCMESVTAPAQLSRLMTAAGFVERDPSQGPRGPAIAGDGPGRHLWVAPSRPGEIDGFTGFAPPGPNHPFAVCWHVSRPGDSAATALAELRRRYPPLDGTVQTGTALFYGGFERWSATVDGRQVFIGVEWPMQDDPAQGVALLYAATPAGSR